MSQRRSFYNVGAGSRTSDHEASAERIWQSTRDIERHGVASVPQNGALRRVNAVQGQDLTQKYDPFGNNKFTDASNPWAGFFGAPSAPWKTASYDQYDHSNWALPEAYVGQNEYLGRTIDAMIYTDETFYTQVLMPFKYTSQVSVAWDVWTFNEHFTGIVPEMGISRLVSSKREAHSDSFVRHGMGAIFEHGFMSTPEGRAHYVLTLAQIARAVLETINFGVIYAYLTCHDYSKAYESKHGYFKRETLQDLLRRENFMWAIAVKTEFGMEKLDARIVEWMNAHRTDADTWILPPGPTTYLRLVPVEKTHYDIAGPEGPARVNGIVSAGRPHEANDPSKRLQDIVEPYGLFKKNKVYISRSYDVDQTGPIDLLSRMSSVGEYFKIVNMDNECTYGKSYMTCMTNTRIFDEDSNGGYTATMMEGLKHCQVFNEDGTPRVLDGLSSPIDAGDLRSVFWLRPEVDSTGAEVFKNIEIMGDIDPVFFGTDDLANLTRTWTKSLVNSGRESDDEARKIDQRLTAGAALVSRLSMMPITDASGDFTAFGPANTADAWQRAIAGVTTYKGLQALETAGGQRPEAIVAREFIEALDNVVPKLQMTMGGKENMFLNPANSLPMYGAGSAARTLYENLFNYNSVPLYVARDVSPAGAVSPLLTEAVSRTQKALRTPGARTAAEWTDAGVDLAAYTAIYNGLTNSAQLGAADQRVAIDRALDYIFAHTAVAKTTNVNNIRAWVGQMRELVGQASAQQATRQRTGAGGGAPVVSQNLAVSRQHPQLAPNAATSLRSLGYLPASRLDVTEPAGVYEAGDQTAPTVLTIGSKASLFETMPIMQSVLSETSARATQKGGARGAGARGFGSLFGEDDDVDDVNQPIGSLLGGGRQMHRQTQAIADRRRYLAQTGVVLSEGVDSRLRFGTLAYNLEQLEQSSIGGLGRAVAAVYLAAPWRRQTLEGFLTHNVMPNFGFLGFRIGLYDMALGIKCKAGAGTGITYFGNSRFMLSDDATTMMHYGNYTHYGKSVVHRPQNVFIAYDIAPNRCLGGMGVKPYTHQSQYNAAQGLNTRDIFWVMVPYAEKIFPTVMDMAGRFYSYMDSGMLDDEDPANRELHYSTAAFYNRVWGWYSDEDVTTQIDEPLYRMNNPGQNRIVWQGAQGTWKPEDNTFNKNIIRNRSPWGPQVHEGCRDWRDGMMVGRQEIPFGVLGF